MYTLQRRLRLDVENVGAYGKGEASRDEIDMLGDVTNQIAGHTICAFGEGSSWPVQGLLRHFQKKLKVEINLIQLSKNKKIYLI